MSMTFTSREDFLEEGVIPVTWLLEADSARCTLCLEDYAESSEEPICFSTCHHVFGSECVRQLRDNRCPLCRAVLWEVAPPAPNSPSSSYADYGYSDDSDDNDEYDSDNGGSSWDNFDDGYNDYDSSHDGSNDDCEYCGQNRDDCDYHYPCSCPCHLDCDCDCDSDSGSESDSLCECLVCQQLDYEPFCVISRRPHPILQPGRGTTVNIGSRVVNLEAVDWALTPNGAVTAWRLVERVVRGR